MLLVNAIKLQRANNLFINTSHKEGSPVIAVQQLVAALANSRNIVKQAKLYNSIYKDDIANTLNYTGYYIVFLKI